MMGRKPKPTAVHITNGNPSKRPHNRREPKAPPGIPAPFSHLAEPVKNAWLEIGHVLNEIKVVTLAHGHALEQMAENLVEIRELRAEIAKHGRFQNVRMTNGAKKQMVRPAVIALSDAEKRFRAMMEQFGMTASAATRINANIEDEKEKDPAQKYFAPRLVK